MVGGCPFSSYSASGGLEFSNSITYTIKLISWEKKVTILKNYDLLILFLYTIGYVLELQTEYLC